MKKIIVIFLVLVCAGLGYFVYSFLQNKAFETKNPIEIIPTNAAVIFESKDIRNAWSRLAETNLVYDAALNNASFKNLDNIVHKADSLLSTVDITSNFLDNKSTVFSLHSGDGVQFFMATNGNEQVTNELGKLLAIYGQSKEIEIDNHKVYQYVIQGENYFLTHLKPFVILCSDASLISNSIAQIKEQKSLLDDKDFLALRSSHNGNLSVQVYLNGPKTGSLFSTYLTKSIAEKFQNGEVLPKWLSFDINEKSNAIIINGLSTSDANNSRFTNTLTQTAGASKSLWLLPTDLLSYKRAAISDPIVFIQNNSVADLKSETEKCGCNPEITFSDWMKDELISISFGNDKAMDNAYLIGCSGYSNLAGNLTSFGVSDTVFKNIYNTDIFEITDNSFLKLVGIVDTSQQSFYYARMNDFAIFSTYNGIAKIAYQWKASQASIPTNSFINFSQKLMANYSSNDIYLNTKQALNLSVEYLKPEYQEIATQLQNDLSKINGIIWQSSIAKNNMIYHSIAINTNESNNQNGATQKLWSLSMQKNIVGSPQIIRNHQTGTNEIIVQDETNTIHLIGATGKVKWFKNINEPIIGEITQIDLYKNGKYQMLFNTATKIHLIDINGNEVTGYPIKLPSNASNQVAVFDYDRNGDYRFLIATMDKKILNYSKDGKSVVGWLSPASSNIVVSPITHFVVDNKDYICSHDISGNINLFNRKGEVREAVLNKIESPDKANIFLQNGTSLATTKFIYLDSNDLVNELPLEGPKKTFQLDSNIYDFYQYTVDIDNDKLPEFIVAFGNKLSVYGPDKSLSFQELYEFDLKNNVRSIGNNNKYTLIADNENEKIYLFNHQFKALPGFPLKGTISSCIGDLNKDGNQEVITITGGKQITAYSINPLFGI